ncbi:CHASE3 domain-containing protein [uncultured Aureimonas sp.]|uniref:CHASE3 domain-containing protein n=1 Tax=uncultured Aureimonas sp. TaxID=1604662 RepID=UPI0025DF16B7|nr:CHASE3 domain-containing protein [uncultured Aureimonas sp.]
MPTWAEIRKRWLTRALVLRSVPVGVVILAGIIATTWTHSLLNDHRDLVVHTYRVIDNTKDLLIALDDAETGERGFLISGDRRFLDPYEKALERMEPVRTQLRQLISDNPSQIARTDHLSLLVGRKLAELAESVTLFEQDGFPAAQKQSVAMMERATMDEIRRVIGDITETEKALLATRDALVDRDENRVRLVAILIALASLAVRTGVEFHLARWERKKRLTLPPASVAR